MPEWYDVFNIIEQNKNVPFVQRIINKDKYPSIKNKDGSYSTHKMMWGQSGDKYYVFPSIEMIGENLIDLQKEGVNPFEYALKSKNYIEFGTAEEADWFSRNYKSYWDMLGF